MGQQGKQENGAESAELGHRRDIVDASGSVDAIGALPVALIGLLLLASVWWDGAFDLRYWAPLTILSLALVLALLVAGPLQIPGRGPLAVSLAAIWGFAAWVALSALWAKSPSAAWTEAARTTFYAALWTLAVGVAARGSWRERLGGGLSIGIGVIALVTLIGMLVGTKSLFLAGRLDSPIGYRNATAALFALAAWPLIGYTARRGRATGPRAAAFAVTVLVLGLAFLTQSRGVVIGLALGGVVSLAIGPDRVRRAWTAIAAVAAIAIVSGPLLDPYDTFSGGTLVVGSSVIEHAAVTLLLMSGACFVVALLAAVYDNGLRSAALDRRIGQLAAASLVVVALGAGAVALAKIGNPVSYAETKVDEFNESEGASTGSTRLGSVGGQRSDLWRVALNQFDDHPVAGGGAGSYEFAYYLERDSDRNLSDAHSLPMRILADLGLVGAVLFALWAIAVGVAIARRARVVAERERVWVAGLAAAGTTVFAQCLTDWLWLLPGLLGLAILALGVAAGGEPPERERKTGWTPIRVGAIAALSAAAISVTFLFLGDLYVRKARVEAFRSPQAELSAAGTAAFFNPVSVTPLFLEAGAFESEGRRADAKAKLEDARDREPDNFVPLGLLGDFEVRGGDDMAARGYYREALALNPLDTGLKKLSEGAE